MIALIESKSPALDMTMTSREIAELTGKRHDHVMRDIRKILEELYPAGVSPEPGTPHDVDEYHRSDRTQYKFLTPGTVDAFMDFGSKAVRTAESFESTYTDQQNGQSYPIFHLPKRETLVLIAGYSIQLRAKIIDRWQQLEEQAQKPAFAIPQTMSEALRLAADLAEGKARAELELAEKQKQLEVATPKADALDRFSTFAQGSMCITNAAKALQVQPKRFFAWLQQNQWIYRRAGGSGWIGYQSRLQVGYLEHKVTTVERSDGSERTVEQVLVTAKGLAKLAQAVAGVTDMSELRGVAA